MKRRGEMIKKYYITLTVCLLLLPLMAGATWPKKRITWTAGDSQKPAIAADSNDHMHLVLYDDTSGNDEIYYKKSTDGGESWPGIKRLTRNSGSSEYPAIAVDTNNHIHVVWQDDTHGNYEVYYKKSTNGGVTWTSKRLTWNSGDSYRPSIAIDTNNHIHLVLYDDTPGNYEIFYKKSTDGGTTWTKAKRLTWNSGSSEYPAIAVDTNNHIYVVWQDDTTGGHNTYYKKSTNGGVNWTGKRITWSGAIYPDIAIDSNDHIHVVYMTYPGIHYKKSTNGGANWTGKRITWMTDGSYCSLFDPAIAVDSNNHLHVVFSIYCGGTAGYRAIYYKKSTDGGTHWLKSLLVAVTVEYSYEPDIAIDSNGHIHVVWEDEVNETKYEIFYAKNSPEP